MFHSIQYLSFPQILYIFVNESSPEYRSRTVGNIFVKGETITHGSGWDNYGVGGSICYFILF